MLALPAAAAWCLAGCAGGGSAERASRPPDAVPASSAPLAQQPGALAIEPQLSLVEILVWRDGPMAALGHNHVIAARDLHGAVLLTPQLVGSRLELSFDVNTLSIDDATLRAAEGTDFAANVPDSARKGTRDNMLGQKLLDGMHFAAISVRGRVLRATANDAVVAATLDVKGRSVEREVNVTLQRDAGGVTGSGELALRQSELGLTPFSVMLGALQVRDEMRVKFRIVAHRAPAT